LSKANNVDELGVVSTALAGIESGEGVALSNVDQVIQLTASGKAQELLEVIRHYDTKISKRITGQTLTSNTQQYGSRSLGEVHERAALRIAQGDLKMVFGCLNATLLRWIFTLNGKPGHVRLVFDKKAFEAHLKAQQSGGVTLSNPGSGSLLCL
jgi:phage gp29-like protein